MSTHGNCSVHQFRDSMIDVRSIGRVVVQTCNNCLSVLVVQRRDVDEEPTKTVVEMKDSAYSYVK